MPRLPQVRIPILHKGSLSAFGYRMRIPSNQRQMAIRDAISIFGVGDVVKKLNALRVFNKYKHPDLYNIATQDMYYAQSFY